MFFRTYVKYVEDNFEKFFPKGNDAQIADAILELFRKRESIEIFNKKALYIYIREMTGVETPVITKVTNSDFSIFSNISLIFILFNDILILNFI